MSTKSIIASILQDESSHMAILKRMDDSEFRFQLTGSRAFGISHRGSDFDFYAQDSKEIRALLELLGFTCIFDANKTEDGGGYQNYGRKSPDGWTGLNAVYRHVKVDIQIDVQLVSNPETKKIAQELLSKNLGLLQLLRKQGAHMAWKLAFEAAELVQHYQGVAGAAALRRAQMER